MHFVWEVEPHGFNVCFKKSKFLQYEPIPGDKQTPFTIECYI